jgi:hypothetical protein
MSSGPSEAGPGRTPEAPGLTPWDALTPERQLELREAYGHYLDSLPPTCSLEEKVARFARWLRERGVRYP